MNIKQKILYVLCRTVYRAPNYVDSMEMVQKNVNLDQIATIWNTTVNVIKITENENCYFRECRKQEKFSVYLMGLLKDYFYFMPQDALSEKQKQVLTQALLNKTTQKKLYKMGSVNDTSSRVSKFFKQKDLDVIGLSELKINFTISEITDFVQYLWGEILSYRLNGGIKQNHYQTFSSSRVIATKKLADLLGIGYLIPDVSYGILSIDGQENKVGTFMLEAKGISPVSLTKKQRKKVAPSFQRNCSDLNILDAICYEKDHRPGNYNVLIDKDGLITGLQAFDNDCPLTFFLTSSIKHVSYWGSTSLVDSTGKISLPFMSKKVAKRILELEYFEVKNILKNILSELQIYCLWRRIVKMKKAISKTYQERPDFLLENNEWSDETLKIELEQKNYNGYLNIFCNSDKTEINYAK